jgi:hypothetical protein
MERLTETIKGHGFCNGKQCTDDCDDCNHFHKILTKLAQYEDTEEQGLLLRLPQELSNVDEQIIKYTLAKAVSLVKYGVDVDAKLEGAVETSYALHNAYMKGTKDAVDRIYESKTKIRNKAIDEFAEKLATNVESFQAEVNGIRADLMTEDYFHEYIWKIAEQMKGE